MSAPQMKERPASMLRSMFAGLGSLLHVMDKVRSKPAKQQTPAEPETKAAPAVTPPAAAEPEATTGAEPEVTPETLAEAEDALADVDDTDGEDTVAVEDTAAKDTAAKDTAVEETTAEDTVEPEIVLVETDIVMVETDPVTGEPEVVVVETEIVALPLVNYDELSVASLRARLRNLSVEQLNEVLGYEKAHAARPDVITMFERRIAKVQAES